jgi:hypothetical protein
VIGAATGRHAYLSNSHVFLMWMLGTSAMLLAVGYLVLRPVARPDRFTDTGGA